MRLPKICGFTASFSYSISRPRGQARHHLTLWEQPLHRWLLATMYHWYDSRVCRLPGFRALERCLAWLQRGDEMHIPLGCRQDLRCYRLQHEKRTMLVTFDISAEDFERIQRQRSTSGRAPAL